ncbi:MAG: TetR/AcrR family transcriptional regulator [Cyanobacteria bacterium J06555_13]
MPRASSQEIKEQILDVAEGAIARDGYAGTTLRNIVGQANVNLAAVHYHFGSKEDLLRAVLARISQPIVAAQLTALEQLMKESGENGNSPLMVESILRAYLSPALSCVVQHHKARPLRAQFIGRSRTEPDPVQQIATDQFRPGTDKVLDALQRALPDQSRSQLEWKLDLVVACLIRVLAQAGKPGALLVENTDDAFEVAVSKLIAFVLPGLENS